MRSKLVQGSCIELSRRLTRGATSLRSASSRRRTRPRAGAAPHSATPRIASLRTRRTAPTVARGHPRLECVPLVFRDGPREDGQGRSLAVSQISWYRHSQSDSLCRRNPLDQTVNPPGSWCGVPSPEPNETRRAGWPPVPLILARQDISLGGGRKWANRSVPRKRRIQPLTGGVRGFRGSANNLYSTFDQGRANTSGPRAEAPTCSACDVLPTG